MIWEQVSLQKKLPRTLWVNHGDVRDFGCQKQVSLRGLAAAPSLQQTDPYYFIRIIRPSNLQGFFYFKGFDIL